MDLKKFHSPKIRSLFPNFRILLCVFFFLKCVPDLKIDKICDTNDPAKFLREAFAFRTSTNQEFYCNLRIRDRINSSVMRTGTGTGTGVATGTGTTPIATTLTFTTEPIPLFNFPFRPSGQATMPIIADTIWTPALITDSATYTANVKYRVGSIKFNLTTSDQSAIVTLNGTTISNLANIPNQTLNIGANTFTFIATSSSGTTT